MDKYSIGTNAGIVWRLMNNDHKWSYQELKEKSELSDRELNAAIGWLAREDKIQIEEDVNTHQETYFQFFNTYY
ncbi:winged helix-turn-helix domain-containing protein [Parabacteroides distasonis]|uniref:winged helix-turn-helix domain-containing protein n=1 Tax=Parabacteroides distasonis TaxID=823 RepID=UPI00232FF4C5|nr:winged helix-turn-helix domain-containing protein [Parabacteroides distasonis]MDB9029182.1 winged helix-turn-helix domain-containing protein [Parabacteroides distasonis]MDB9074983.1 winged helix-turn-helix domain-containing protein [Parabacteroides distasonis]